MQATAVDAELFEAPLERLALLNDDLALARRRWVARKCPLAEGGSTTNRVPHVLLRVQGDLGRQILQLEQELALTPTAQRKIGRGVRGGRPQGAASAPDRAQPPRRRSSSSVKLIPIGERAEKALAEAMARAESR